MLNVPENLSGAVNRQTVLTINTKKVMEPLSSHSIGSINNMSCRNSPHTRSAPVTASSSVRATAPSADSSSVRTTAQSAARTVPILKNPARKGQKVSLETNARITGIRAYLGWDITNPECDVDVSAFLLNIQARLSAIPGLSSTVRKQARMEVLLLGQVRKRIMRSYLWTLTD